jgi:outer membrane lipoprotein-sorting protein
LNFLSLWPISRRKTAAAIAGVTLLLSGCIIRRTPVPQNQRLLPAQTRSFADILQILRSRSEAIKTLKAVRVVFQPSTGARKKNQLTELRVPIEGYLLVNRPNEIHIHLSAPLVKTTLADMVSDGREYKVWAPLNNRFYVGEADESIQIAQLDLQLPPPKDIASAMFIDISPYLDDPAKYRLFQTEAFQGQHSYYVVSIVNIEGNSVEAQARQEIWIDRTNMEIVRQATYGKDGVLLTDTDFAGYPSSGEVLFPKVVTIHRPVEDVDLTIRFVDAEPNANLSEDSFRLTQPDGSELIRIR